MFVITALVIINALTIPNANATDKIEILTTICEHSQGDLILQEISTEIAKVESNFEPSAKNKFSSAGGIFQWLKSSWKHYNCTGDRFDYKANIKCSLEVMRNYGFSDWDASYNLWFPKLSSQAKLRITEDIKPLYKIVSFISGKVKIDYKGSILDNDGEIWKGGEDIPFF